MLRIRFSIQSSGYPLALYNSLVRCAANSGFSISSGLSEPTFANQSFNGSALGDGIDWIIHKRPCACAV